MPQRTFGKYVVVRLIGRGPVGEVFEASDPGLDRRVAVKAVYAHLSAEPGFSDRFRSEARRAAVLRYPRIAQVLDVDTSGERAFLVREYVEGGSLRDSLAAGRASSKALSLSEAAGILDGVAQGLDYAHARGLAHGDLTPSNIILNAQDEPTITDFAFLRAAGSGALLGTPAYMSPEQAAGTTADAHSDLYSLGVILYEMCTGAPPFSGDSPMAVLMQHLNTPPPAPESRNPILPAQASVVLNRALAKDPAQRYASASELAAAFRAALAGAPVALETVVSPATAPVSKGQPPPSGGPPPRVSPAQPSGAAAAPRRHWLAGLASVAAALAPLVGKGALDVREAPRDRRTLIATILGIVSILFAAFQFLEQFFNFVVRPFAPLMRALPYTVGALFILGAALSLFVMLRSESAVNRRRGAVTLVAITVVGLAWGTWAAVTRLRPPSGFIVAVGEFDDEKATRHVDFARRIYEQLKRELSTVGGEVQVMRTGEVYKTAEAARRRGASMKATLVIWGWHDDTGVSPFVEALQVPLLRRETLSIPSLAGSVANAISQGLSPVRGTTVGDVSRYVRTPEAMADFDLFVKNGPQQLTYVSAAVLGMAFYLNGDSARALALFDKALANAPAGGSDVVGQEVVYFQRSTALYQQDRVAEAAQDLERALALKPDFFEAHHNLAIVYAEVCTPTRQLDRAIAEGETAVRLGPDSAPAHRLLGDLLLQSGQTQRGLGELQAAVKADPGDALAFSLLARAQDAMGQADAAIASRQTAVGLREKASAGRGIDRLQAHLDLGDAYLGAAQYQKALAEYQQAQRMAPDEPRIHRALGNAYYWLKNVDQAIKEYQAWAAADPKAMDAYLLLGLVYLEQNKPAEAIAALSRAAALADCDAAPHLVLSGEYWEQGDNLKAISEGEAALAIEPKSTDALYLLGILYWEQGRLDDSVSVLQRAVSLQPDMAVAHYGLGKAYMDQGAYDQAASEWALASQYAPDNPGNFAALAHALERLERWDEAAAAYQKSLALKDDPLIRVWLGMVYQQQGKLDQAFGEYENALRLNPEEASAYWAQGDVYSAQGKLEEAATAYLAALKREDEALLHASLASVRARQGRVDEAVAEYLKAAALDPQDWLSRLRAGDLLLHANRLDEAAAQYQAALTVNANLPEAHFGLELLAYKRCNISTMEQEARAALALAPNVSFYKGQVAAVADAQGRTADAARLFDELRAAPGSDIVAHLLAADYLLRNDKLDDSAREAQAVLSAQGLVPALASAAHGILGQAYDLQGRPVPAQSEFNLALEALPSNAEAQTWLGDLALKEGDVTGALGAYDKALALLPEYALVVSADNASLQAIMIHVRRALAYTRAGKTSEAAKAYDSALALCQQLLQQAPNWPSRHFALAVVYAARGDNAKADAEFAAAAQCDQSMARARTRAEEQLACLR